LRTERHWFNMTRRGLLLRSVSLDVIDQFGRQHIPVVVLKGEIFADHLYPRPDLRPFGDVDLLVPQRDFPRAQRVMSAAGFRLSKPDLKHGGGYGQSA
jgi:hypothetical protein